MRVPSTFECRPTAANLPPTSLPDELMIEWVGVPDGATASIFLPAASADAIAKRAAQLYGGQRLAPSDAHTLECDANTVTYIPIPADSVSDYAGLLTLDLPESVGERASSKVIVRQITNAEASRDAVSRSQIRRRVMGSFQLSVPTVEAPTQLESEARLLAFFRWILITLPSGDRWRLVIERYVGEIASRVKVFGGDPTAIAPSQVGAIPSNPVCGQPPMQEQEKGVGKIEQLAYDRFGDFEGFILRSDSGAELAFHTRARHFAELARWAWQAQLRVTVFASEDRPHEPVRILLHAPGDPPGTVVHWHDGH